MRCFYHQDKEAIGSSKSCGKGSCPECAVDMVPQDYGSDPETVRMTTVARTGNVGTMGSFAAKRPLGTVKRNADIRGDAAPFGDLT